MKLPNCDTSLTYYDKPNTNSQVIKSNLNQILARYSSHNEITTDASNTNEGVGAAVVTTTNIFAYKLPAVSSIFTAGLHKCERE
ncbi:hypothetical protein JTB14_030251 [Gonioctena quinquepunctata]|nr:hypothetical protein JTB14_030251 [Gonioctena quinquepunctata]